MKKWTRTLIAGSALILLSNAVVLLGAAYNRSDEAESLLKLSQRELKHLPWRTSKDNSGITLTMNWRIGSKKASLKNDYDMGYSSNRWGNPEWLNQAKMAALGFDVDRLVRTAEDGRHHYRSLPREALLVLELNDKAYQRELRLTKDYTARTKESLKKNPNKEEILSSAKRAEEVLKSEEQTNSRLFAIDAGTDLSKLRATYPDRARYAIVHGLIYPSISGEKNKIIVEGYIREVHAEKINVPFVYRDVFNTPATPYEVSVAFGKRLEPWITSATRSAAVK